MQTPRHIVTEHQNGLSYPLRGRSTQFFSPDGQPNTNRYSIPEEIITQNKMHNFRLTKKQRLWNLEIK